MTLSIVAAMTEDRVIGAHNDLPWHLPDDFKRFKTLTLGHAVIMGRKTFDSLGGKPLPGRKNIVVTRNPTYRPEGAIVVHDLGAALREASSDPEPFIAGGAEIYAAALPNVDRIYLTVIHYPFPGDTHFPEFDRNQFELKEEEDHISPPPLSYKYTFQTWVRRPR